MNFSTASLDFEKQALRSRKAILPQVYASPRTVVDAELEYRELADRVWSIKTYVQA